MASPPQREARRAEALICPDDGQRRALVPAGVDQDDNAEVLGAKAGLLPVRPWRITEPQEVHAPWKEASKSKPGGCQACIKSRPEGIGPFVLLGQKLPSK